MRNAALVILIVLAASLALSGCEGCSVDPHRCGPEDVDGDGDGRCNE